MQLFENRGINMEYLPEQVTLLPDLKSQQWLMADTGTFVRQALRRGRFGLLLRKAWAILRPILRRNTGSQYKTLCAWKAIRRAFPRAKEPYDVAVAYLQGVPIYYVADCVQAKRKLGWMHIDYSKIDNVPRQEVLAYYRQLDAFISMSSKCVEELRKAFPSIKQNIHLLHNLNSVRLIEELSGREEARELLLSDSPTILSIGRLCEQKGYDYAIQAAAIMAQNRVPFRWYVLGTGELEASLRQMVADNGLEDRFFFLGLKSNPYPYLRQATVVAQTSRYEGKSVVLDEAKILKKPILVTAYNSVGDQIEHGKTGYVVDIDAEAIARGMTTLLENAALREQLTANLEDASAQQEYWLNKHYELFEG